MAPPFQNLTEAFPILKNLNRETGRPEEGSPSLKTDAKRDLKKGAVWFSDDEHARYREVNGAMILCILDRYDISTVAGGAAKAEMSRRQEGIQADTLLLFIRADEYRGTPRHGQEIKIHGVRYTILNSIDFDGVLEITIRGVFAR